MDRIELYTSKPDILAKFIVLILMVGGLSFFFAFGIFILLLTDHRWVLFLYFFIVVYLIFHKYKSIVDIKYTLLDTGIEILDSKNDIRQIPYSDVISVTNFFELLSDFGFGFLVLKLKGDGVLVLRLLNDAAYMKSMIDQRIDS
jgi:hypothetical protein